MRAGVVTTLFAVAALAVVASPAAAAPTCHLAGSWSQSTEKIGSSTWVITADGQAQEQGLGYATGTATLSGGVLTITWTTTGGYAGVYRWTLDAQCGGTGMLTWTQKPPGETRGTTFASTVDGRHRRATTTTRCGGSRGIWRGSASIRARSTGRRAHS